MIQNWLSHWPQVIHISLEEKYTLYSVFFFSSEIREDKAELQNLVTNTFVLPKLSKSFLLTTALSEMQAHFGRVKAL